MLPRHVPLALGHGHLQRTDEHAAGFGRVNDVVDQPAGGGDVGVVELGLIVIHQFAAPGLRVFGGLHVAAEENVDRPLRAHDGDLGVGPGKQQVATQPPAAHDAVGPAVAFAQDDQQLGHGGLAVGVDHACAVADDAAQLLIAAGQEAGHVLQGDDGHVVGVADADEVGGLDRCLDVDAAGQHHRLVGDDADDVAVEPGEANDHVLGPQLVHLEERAVVNDAADDLAHVVGVVGVGGHDLL